MDGSASFGRCSYELGTLVQVLRGQDVVIPVASVFAIPFFCRSTPRVEEATPSGINSALGEYFVIIRRQVDEAEEGRSRSQPCR